MFRKYLLPYLFFVLIIRITNAQSANVLSFDGINDYVSIPNNAEFNLTNNYTIECWIYVTEFHSLAGIVSKYHTPGANGFSLRLSQTEPYTGLNFDEMTTDNGILTANTWYHIAAVNTNGVRSLYVNGVQIPLGGTAINVAVNNDNLVLGADYITNPRYFNGKIDEFRLWNIARSQSDIVADKDISTNPATSGLIAAYSFNQGVSEGNNLGFSTLTDATSPAENGTLTNFALTGTTSNWVLHTRLFVKADATGSNNGSNWTNAYTDLQTALNHPSAKEGVEIWVNGGTYRPTNNTDRTMTFNIQSGAKVYGGFGGNETTLDSRNWHNNATILSGNIGDINTKDDNSYHVVIFRGAKEGTILSGFTIMDGNAFGDDDIYENANDGGGILNLAYNYISANNIATTGFPTLEYCKVINNNAQSTGGGIYSGTKDKGSIGLKMVNCLVTNNKSQIGGGIYFDGEALAQQIGLDLINCTIVQNMVDVNFTTNAGGVVYWGESYLMNLKNCILWANSFNEYSCGFRKVPIITNSHIEGVTTNTEPVFSNATNNDFSIANGCSPVVNAGTNEGITSVYDLNHNQRIRSSSGKIDIGAYEYHGNITIGKRYLNPVGAGNMSGTDWYNASSTFPANAVIGECSIAEVWVAAGTYTPTKDGDKTKSFLPVSGIKYYGGFSGNETSLNQRKWEINKTILSGNIGALNDSLDNSYSVVKFVNADRNTLLDGFIIRDGNSNTNGGGISNQAVVSSSTPVIANCIITNNAASNSGGGVFNGNTMLKGFAEITLVNTAIYKNKAGQGGAISNYSYADITRVKVINCTIAYNKAINEGGAIINSANSGAISIDSLYNNIIWGNTASTYPSVYNNGSGASYAAYYSNIEGITANPVNRLISQNPQFVSPALNNYTPSNCNPAIDGGNLSYLNPLTVALKFDILGNRRVRGNIDMGAYEYIGPKSSTDAASRKYVKKTATGKNDGSSWADAFNELSFITDAACIKANEIWVAAGTYLPSHDNQRYGSFTPDKDTQIYGGFTGTETALEARNWQLNPTILSGNIGDTNVKTDNSIHVVRIDSANISLDGFIVQHGYAIEDEVSGFEQKGQIGGGILVSATNQVSEVNIKNCIIINNEAYYGGGGIAHYGYQAFASSTLKLSGSLLTNNKAWQGGAFYHYAVSSTPDSILVSSQLTNCTIAQNISDVDIMGGLFYTHFGAKVKSNLVIKNSILWENSSPANKQINPLGKASGINIAYSAIQNNDFVGTNIIATDPQFDTGAFTLKPTSPCRNVGDIASATLAGLNKDLGTNERVINLKIDLGAFEGGFLCLSNQHLTQTFNSGTQSIQDGNVLTSTSKINPTTNTTFDAKNAIILQPGFMAGGNSVVFKAEIGGCSP